MSMLEKRLQVLIDEARFAALEQRARSTGRSVGSLVREAIDVYFVDATADARRAAAAARLLAEPMDEGVEPEWEASKALLAEASEQHLR